MSDNDITSSALWMHTCKGGPEGLSGWREQPEGGADHGPSHTRVLPQRTAQIINAGQVLWAQPHNAQAPGNEVLPGHACMARD